MEPFTIMCFSWNADGLKLCETMSQKVANDHRQAIFGVMKSSCIAPDFFEDIRNAIRSKFPSLVVMVTEDEANKGTYFHSDLLPNAMPEIGYTLLQREKLNDVTEGQGSVRISIYARDKILTQLESYERLLTRFFGTTNSVICNQDSRKSGAIAIYINHKVFGRFAFIATHLPVGTTIVDISSTIDYDSYRAIIRATNTLCIVTILDKLVNSLSSAERPDHVILLGDLNYDIAAANITKELTTNFTIQTLRNLRRYDELYHAMNEAPLLGFKEGVSGEGPLFLPTFRLQPHRGANCQSTTADSTCFLNAKESKESKGHIGWHDRILYKDMLTSSFIIHCTEYNRIDVGNIHESTHAAVAGFYELRAIK